MSLTTALTLLTAQLTTVGTFIYGILSIVIPVALGIAAVYMGFRWLKRFTRGRA